MDKFFGYQEEEEEEGGDGDEKADEGAAGEEVIYSQKGSPRSAATSALPPHLRSVRGRTQTVVPKPVAPILTRKVPNSILTQPL